MSDFNITDLDSGNVLEITSGDEVTLYLRPGGTRDLLINYETEDFDTAESANLVWRVQGDNQQNALAATLGGIGLPSTGSGFGFALLSLAAFGASFNGGVLRYSVFLHYVNTAKFFRVRLIFVPFLVWTDPRWLVEGLIDIHFDLRSNKVWSFAAVLLDSALRAGPAVTVTFAIVPVLDGATIFDLSDLTLSMRPLDKFSAPVLLTINALTLTTPAFSVTVTSSSTASSTVVVDSTPWNLVVGCTLLTKVVTAISGTVITLASHASLTISTATVETFTNPAQQYYALSATLDADEIQAAFAALNKPNDPQGGAAERVLPVMLDLIATRGGGVWISKTLPLALEQPIADFS